MMRLLLFIALGVVVFLVLRRLLAGQQNRPPAPPVYEPMVSCMTCGLHLPKAAAVERQGRFYCCREHADQSSR